MATKSPRSPGSQFTSKGVVQGTALTSPIDGQPVAVTIDDAGVHRLAVDAALTADNITVDTRDLSFTTDSVTVGDSNTGAILKINVDGSIDTNTSTTAFSPTPDSELIVGTEDGTVTGTPHVVRVNSDGSLAVSLTQVTFPVISFFNQITSLASNASATILTYTIPVATTGYILAIDVSGTNIATYDVLVNGTQFARKRTYFGGDLDATFQLGDSLSNAPSFVSGTIITVNVTNFRPSVGDFESRIQLLGVT